MALVEPSQLEQPMLTIEEAKAIMKAGVGLAELQFVTSVAAPLFWVTRNQEDDRLQIRNGSAFFLDAGAGLFGVTAACHPWHAGGVRNGWTDFVPARQ